MIKNCVICDQEIEIKGKTLTCSKECKRINKHKIKPDIVKYCKTCNNMFKTNQARIKTCSITCSDKYHTYMNKIKYHKDRNIIIKNCVVCGNTFHRKQRNHLTCSKQCSAKQSKQKSKIFRATSEYKQKKT
jgi:predicted nucleic acid-binding Zn ribbon protein